MAQTADANLEHQEAAASLKAPGPLAARLLTALALGLLACAVALLLIGGDAPGRVNPFGYREFNPMVALSFTLTGALLAGRVPGNPVGWLLLGSGLLIAADSAAEAYASYGILAKPGSVPLPEYAAWVHYWLWVPMVTLAAVFLVLLFPDGRLPSARWRWAVRAGILLGALTTIGYAVDPGALDEFPTVANPLGLPADLDWLALGLKMLQVPLLVLIAPVAWSQVIRYRGASEEGRHQIKWFAAAALMAAAAFLANVLPYAITGFTSRPLQTTIQLALACIPVATGIAVLRYRLYEIDFLINRTLVYVPLTAILAGVYMAMTSILKALVTGSSGGSDPSAAVTTIAVVALLTPVKNHLQAQVDRFFKEPKDAGRELHKLCADVRSVTDALDAERVAGQIVEIASQSLGASWARLRFLHSDGEIAFERGEAAGDAAMTLPVGTDTRGRGELALGPRRGAKPYTAAERESLSQALLALERLLERSAVQRPALLPPLELHRADAVGERVGGGGGAGAGAAESELVVDR